MKAKKVFENNFERNLPPKHSMGIGGINFQWEFDKLYDKWVTDIKNLEGKTISGEFTKHWMEKGSPKSITEIMSVKVEGFDVPHVESMGGGRSIWWKIHFTGEDGFRYSFYLNQKISISE